MKLEMKCILLVLLGSLIQACGISNIHAFSNVTEGGTIGLTLIIYHFKGISPAITSLILNAGCYAFGWKVMGKKFLAYSAISIGFYALSYRFFEGFAPLWPVIIKSPLLCALFGAVFVGVGAGLCVLGGGAPGGDDALAMSLSTKLKCEIQYVYLVTDLVVLLLALSYIPLRQILYSLLTVIISGQIVGLIQKLKK